MARLVRDVFGEHVMVDATDEGVVWWTRYHSLTRANRANIAKRFDACPIRVVAVDRDRIVGTIMGTSEELVRVFIRNSHRGKGLGRRLVERFEREYRKLGTRRYRITAALCSVGFYQRLGCTKTTGVRSLHGLKVQPMRKLLA